MVADILVQDNDTIDAFTQANPEWKDHTGWLLVPPDADEIAEAYPDADRELLDKCLQRLSGPITRGAQYMRMRSNGESDRMASMISLAKCAGLDTDDVFFSGSKPLYDQFESSRMLQRHLDVAKRFGFTPPANAVYFPNLARFKGDPEAYVTRAQGRAYIRQLLERRGWSAEGGVNVKGREPESDPLALENCRPLGEDIIRSRMSEMVSNDPSLKTADRRELRSQILAKHGPSS